MSGQVIRGVLAALLLGVTAPALAQDAPAPAGAVTLEGNRLVLPAPITFVAGTGTLTPESDLAIGAAATWLQGKDYVSTARIEGHTDTNDAASQALSEARAMSVARALVAAGIDCKRLLVVGFGGNKPVADNATAEGKEQNRRVAIEMAALRGRAIGGLPVDGGGKVAGDACAP